MFVYIQIFTNMKRVLFIIFSIIPFFVVGQESTTTQQIVSEVLKVISQDSLVFPNAPEQFNPKSAQNVFDWWVIIYSLVMPLGIWVFHRFFPSFTKKELVLKSTSIAITILLIIVFLKGASGVVISQAILAFLTKIAIYEKFYKSIGLDSKKPEGYKKENYAKQKV